MRIHRLTMRNFRGVVDETIKFADTGVTIIEGDNEIGKSSIVAAIDLVLNELDSSTKKEVKYTKPVNRDVATEVEIELSTGAYRFTLLKRWHQNKATELTVHAPMPEQLTSREAHDRMRTILDETLDEDLWGALWVAQGEELGQACLDGTASLGRALDRAAGGDIADDTDDDLWDRIVDERAKYWTKTGKASTDRGKLEDQLQEARDRQEHAENELRALEADVDLLVRYESETEGYSDALDSALAAASDLVEAEQVLEKQKLAVETLQNGLKVTESLLLASEIKRTRRGELVTAEKTRANDLVDRQSEFERLVPEVAEYETTRDEARTKRDSLELEWRTSVNSCEAAKLDRDHRKDELELEQLQERHRRVIGAEVKIAEADAVLERTFIDQTQVTNIQGAHDIVVAARAAAQVGAAKLEVNALDAVTLELSGEVENLPAGGSFTREITGTLELRLPGTLEISVTGGVDTQRLASEREEAENELSHLCVAAGVKDLQEARSAVRERENASIDRENAVQVLKDAKRDLEPNEIIGKIKRLEIRIEEYASTRGAELPLPVDLDIAQHGYDTALDVVTKLVTALEDAKFSLKTAEDNLNTRKFECATTVQKRDSAKEEHDSADTELELARAGASDDLLDVEEAGARASVEKDRALLNAAIADLNSSDPTSLEDKSKNAKDHVKRARGEIDNHQQRIANLRGSLDARGEQGLADRLDSAGSDVEHLGNSYSRLEARASAALLLHATFSDCRSAAHQRYVAPFRERVKGLGRIVFGADFDVELADDLSIATRTTRGVTLEFDRLSTGAQEQLGIIGRLACASIVSTDEGAPVILDDALGWTDPGRLATMGAVLNTAARDCQVIVLTCTPGRYSSVGGAKVVRLGS